jgi:hypothetical protein
MANTEIQIVSSESGEPTAVIVPIEWWREIASERETAYFIEERDNEGPSVAGISTADGLVVRGRR